MSHRMGCITQRKGGSDRVGSVIQGWSMSHRGRMGHTGVGCVIQEWSGSDRMRCVIHGG